MENCTNRRKERCNRIAVGCLPKAVVYSTVKFCCGFLQALLGAWGFSVSMYCDVSTVCNVVLKMKSCKDI